MVGSSSPRCATAARSAAALANPGVRQGSLHPERRLGGHQTGELHRPVELPPGGHDLLDEPDPPGLVGAELLRRQQEPHGVAPPKLRRGAEGGTAERQDASGDLQLAEAHVGRCDHDVRGERQLDRERVRDALDGHDDRLGYLLSPDPEGVDPPAARQRGRALLGHGRPDLGEVQPGGEVPAVRVQHADPQLVVAGQALVRRRQLRECRQVEGVALLRPVDADQQDVPVPVDGDALALGGSAHGHAATSHGCSRTAPYRTAVPAVRVRAVPYGYRWLWQADEEAKLAAAVRAIIHEEGTE
jgi:hypothetical protein